MSEPKLYMVLLGCRPPGRLTEQHDIFFGIAGSLKELISHIKLFWPEVKGNIHIDAWREITQVNNFQIKIVERLEEKVSEKKLFFLNLGGYKTNEFDEFHYKLLAVANNSGEAIQQAKQTAFYKHFDLKGATSHVDDKYGVDVDEIYSVKEILSPFFKERYSIHIKESAGQDDELHLGYLPLSKIL